MNMRRLIFLISGLMMLSVCSQSIYGQGAEWKRVFFQDFGGNDPMDLDMIEEPILTEEESPLGYAPFPEVQGYSLLKTTAYNNTWHKGSDHTYPDDITRGYYMRINPPASQNEEVMYREKLTNICSGVTFRFSVWMTNMEIEGKSTGQLPNLGIGIFEDEEATKLVSSGAHKSLKNLQRCADENSKSLPWQKLEMEFEVQGDISEAYFIVSAIAPEANGFDFAIDDIEIEVQHPVVSVSPLQELSYQEPAVLQAVFENNGFFADLSSVYYKWQYSKDGSSFSDLPGADGFYAQNNKMSYTIPSFDKDVHNGYYRILIGQQGMLDNEVCTLQGDLQIAETKSKKRVTLCEGETRVVDGVTLDANSLTDGEEVLAAGDLYLVVSIAKPQIEKGEDEDICVGTAVAGVKYDTEGVYPMNDTIKSLLTGCDSLIILKNINVRAPGEVKKDPKIICQGETYENTKYDAAGTFEYRKNMGCLIYVQDVIVNPVYNLNETYTICQGSEFNGKVYDQSGTYSEVLPLKTVTGCDSIINATINVTSKIIVDLEPVEICEGDVYEFGGKTYTAPGEYSLTHTTVSVLSGCDSTTNVYLIIHPKYSNENNPIDTIICYDSYLFGVHYPTPTKTPIKVRDPQTYKTVNGCDSVVWYNLTVLQIQLKLSIKSDRNTVCRGEEIELYIGDLKPSDCPLTWTPNLGGTNSDMKKVFTPSEDFACIVRARNEKAQCETTDTVYVFVRDSPILTIDSVNDKENIVEYTITGGIEPYNIYLDGKELDDFSINSGFGLTKGMLFNTSIGSHTLSVADVNDCKSSGQFSISPVPITPQGVFTPNGDGVNDTWQIENIDVYPTAKVSIYDRDGRVVAEYLGYDNANAWDGTYNGNPLPSTDYWYVINLPAADTQYVGHFTLLR